MQKSIATMLEMARGMRRAKVVRRRILFGWCAKARELGDGGMWWERKGEGELAALVLAEETLFSPAQFITAWSRASEAERGRNSAQ